MRDRLLRTVFRAAAPAGPRSRLTIMIFHRVLPEPDPLRPDEPCAEEFDTTRPSFPKLASRPCDPLAAGSRNWLTDAERFTQIPEIAGDDAAEGSSARQSRTRRFACSEGVGRRTEAESDPKG